jgi:hypothetical protein
LYVLILRFLDRKQEDKKLGTEWWKKFLEFNLLVTFSEVIT